MIKNRISAVGIELEGGWYSPNHDRFHHDGSVKFPDKLCYVQGRFEGPTELVRNALKGVSKLKPLHLGEIASHPLDVTELEDFIKSCYPDAVNATCGLHVHMSFKHKLNYMRLMDESFTRTMVRQLLMWAEEENLQADHPLWERLRNPDHPHCAHTYCGDAQSRMARKDYQSRGKPYSRYTAINYCWEQHRTVEVRLLSMMETSDQAIRAVNKVLDVTNTTLARIREREKKHKIAVPRSALMRDTYRVRV